MDDSGLISILMPVRNAASFLEETIQSVQAQVYSNWELIVVDDFSEDDSFLFLESLQRTDNRIKVFRNKEKGIIPALELAFQHSHGSYISRMDGDDLMPPSKLEAFIKAIEGTVNTVVTGKVRYFSEEEVTAGYVRYENWLNDLVDKGDFWEQIYRECVIASPNWMVSKVCFEEVFKLSDLTYPEDYDMVFKWYANGYTIKGISEITHLWREHPERTSRNVIDYQQAAFFKLKTNRFIQLELEKGENIQLIGTGNKGKLVAAELISRNIEFYWFDLNANKHNTFLKGKEILPVTAIEPNCKSILTVWPVKLEQQEAILTFLESKKLDLGKNCWLF